MPGWQVHFKLKQLLCFQNDTAHSHSMSEFYSYCLQSRQWCMNPLCSSNMFYLCIPGLWSRSSHSTVQVNISIPVWLPRSPEISLFHARNMTRKLRIEVPGLDDWNIDAYSWSSNKYLPTCALSIKVLLTCQPQSLHSMTVLHFGFVVFKNRTHFF